MSMSLSLSAACGILECTIERPIHRLQSSLLLVAGKSHPRLPMRSTESVRRHMLLLNLQSRSPQFNMLFKNVMMQLGAEFPTRLEAPHVVNMRKQVLVGVMGSGPGGEQFQATYRCSSNPQFQVSFL